MWTFTPPALIQGEDAEFNRRKWKGQWDLRANFKTLLSAFDLASYSVNHIFQFLFILSLINAYYVHASAYINHT